MLVGGGMKQRMDSNVVPPLTRDARGSPIVDVDGMYQSLKRY